VSSIGIGERRQYLDGVRLGHAAQAGDELPDIFSGLASGLSSDKFPYLGQSPSFLTEQ
jgi:hypothetical protein